MGISGLLPFLQDASKKCFINEFAGCTVAIDSYCWLHKGAFACAEKLVRGESTNIHISYCLKYIQLLVSYNIKPIMVFDGQHLPAKKGTEEKRREQRKTARARGTELLRLGKVEEARQYFRQCVDITHEIALSLIKECRRRNIDCIVAPYEADAQLAYLNIEGIADIVITEDSDLVLFGCSKILFKFGFDGSGILIERDKLNKAMKMQPDQYTFDKFRYMCILSGCDYLNSLPGIGLKKAQKAVILTHDPDIYNLLPRLPRYLNLHKLTVPQEYIENFKLADATIRHQVVFDPRTRKLVHLTDPAKSGISSEYLRNAGEICENDQSFQMALGNIDPISLKIMDDWNPDVTNSTNSIWSKRYKKEQTPKLANQPILNMICIKEKVIPPEQLLAIQQEEMLQYDIKLNEELKVYYNVEPLSKRRKVHVGDDVSHNLEPNIEPELEVQTNIRNPFIKNKLKKLSKFGLTDLKNSPNVTSPFFSSKSNVDASDLESKENINSRDLQILKQSTVELIAGSIKDESDDINLQFAFNKFIKKEPFVDIFSEQEEHESERFSPIKTNYRCCVLKKCDNESQNKDEDEDLVNENSVDGHMSPVLTYSQFSYNKNNHRVNSAGRYLEAFKFNKSKKNINVLKKTDNCSTQLSLESAISDIEISCGKSLCENSRSEEKDRELDIENLTSEISFSERYKQKDVHYSENDGTGPTAFNDVIISRCEEENFEICVKDESKNTDVHMDIKTIVARKEISKRSNSCGSVGLSRTTKKSTNQPTLLSMFNKMTSQD